MTAPLGWIPKPDHGDHLIPVTLPPLCPTAPDGRHLPTVEPQDGTYQRVCCYCGKDVTNG